MNKLNMAICNIHMIRGAVINEQVKIWRKQTDGQMQEKWQYATALMVVPGKNGSELTLKNENTFYSGN